MKKKDNVIAEGRDGCFQCPPYRLLLGVSAVHYYYYYYYIIYYCFVVAVVQTTIKV